MRQKAILFFLLLALVTPIAKGQNIYFPAKKILDSVDLKRYMPVVAREIIRNLNKTSRKDKDAEFYGCLFTVQTLAGNYKGSLQSLDSLRLMAVKEGVLVKDDASGYLNIYEIYNEIKLIQHDATVGADLILFKQAFPVVLSGFSGNAFQYAIEPYQQDPAAIAAAWQTALINMTAHKSDSISNDQAIIFSQAYLQYLVYMPFIKAGKELIKITDNRNFLIQDSVLIPMRDGAKLAAVIVRNRKDTGQQPVVMMASIYANSGQIQSAKQIAANGYTGIILNTRGKYVSDAAIEPWEHDAADLYDAIDWISKQSWCNGKIGMYGGSYLGFTQWAATKKMHPALKTIVPQVAAAPGIDFPMHNGIFSTYALRWLHFVSNTKLTDNAEFMDMAYWDKSFNKWYMDGQAFNKLDSIDGRPTVMFQKWLKHPTYDQYWQSMIPYQQEFSQINIPVLTITGYFDADQYGALYYFNEHYKWNKKANHYLVIGPYDHGGAQSNPTETVHGYKIDPSAKIDITKLVFDWFDYTLKGKLKPSLLADKINVQVMGADQWVHSPSFQKINNDTLNFYFSNVKADKLFMLGNKKSVGSVGQKMDLAKREIGKSEPNYKLLSDSLDSSGAVVFISNRLENTMSINGRFKGLLSLIVNKKDLDFAVVLYQQQPDGKYFMLSSSIQRASSSGDIHKRILLRPGIEEKIGFTGSFISKKIAQGSRFVVAVSVVKNKNLQVNYGSGKDVSLETVKDAKGDLEVKWTGNSLIQIPVKR